MQDASCGIPGQAKPESACCLTLDMQSPLEALVATKEQVIPSEKPYVFAGVCEALFETFIY